MARARRRRGARAGCGGAPVGWTSNETSVGCAAVSRSVRAIRGATTLDDDTRDQMIERVTTLLADMFGRNHVDLDDVISIFFTATDDLHCMFPAEAARTMGLADIPLMCACELAI